MDLLKEKKEKKVFLDCLDQIITHDLNEVFFSEKPCQKQLMQFTHPLFRLMLMLKGKKEYDILSSKEVKNLELFPGRALFCQQRAMTKVPDNEVDESGEMLTLVFFPQYIRFLISRHQKGEEDNHHIWYHSTQAVNQTGIHVLRALNELVITGDTGIKACFLIKTLLHVSRDNLIADNPQNITKSFRTYQNIKAYLHENADKNINRETVANAFKLNPSHISKLFAAYDEHNFNTVLKLLRLEHAVELLRDTRLPINEISEQCGFVNTGYFIKTFRLFYNKTPGAFRQLNYK